MWCYGYRVDWGKKKRGGQHCMVIGYMHVLKRCFKWKWSGENVLLWLLRKACVVVNRLQEDNISFVGNIFFPLKNVLFFLTSLCRCKISVPVCAPARSWAGLHLAECHVSCFWHSANFHHNAQNYSDVVLQLWFNFTRPASQPTSGVSQLDLCCSLVHSGQLASQTWKEINHFLCFSPHYTSLPPHPSLPQFNQFFHTFIYYQVL